MNIDCHTNHHKPQATIVDLINMLNPHVSIPDCINTTRPYTEIATNREFYKCQEWIFKNKTTEKIPNWSHFIKNRVIPIMHY